MLVTLLLLSSGIMMIVLLTEKAYLEKVGVQELSLK